MFSCDLCQKTFEHERSLKRHRLTHQPEKKPPKRTCPHCPATFNRADNLKKHIKNIHSSPASKKSFTCALCPKSFSELKNLKRHIHQSHQQTNRFKCPHCKAEYSREDNLDLHLKVKHATPDVSAAEATATRAKRERKARLRVDQFPDDEPEDFLENKEEEEEEKLKKIQKEHWSSIKTHSRKGKVQTFVNVRWENQSSPNFSEILTPLFQNSKTRFKIQASHGFVLRHQENEEEDVAPATSAGGGGGDDDDDERFRYFHACENNHSLFEEPIVVNNQNDFNDFLDSLKDKDHLEFARQERPNTKFSVEKITNTSFYIYPMPDFPMGHVNDDDEGLPAYFAECHGLHTLMKNYKTGRPYTDKKCFFRALALHQGAKISAVERRAEFLLRRFLQQNRKARRCFEGVSESELHECEKVFDVCIEVFEFEEDAEIDKAPFLTCVRRSAYAPQHTEKSAKPLQLLAYKDHFCYIKNVDRLGHAFACSKCKKLWKNKFRLNRHEKTCNGTGQKHTYTGGVYIPPPSPLERLSRHGLSVDASETFPFRATFDFETYFEKDNLPKTKKLDSKTVYTARHVPLSVSVCSNVPGYDEPKFFVNRSHLADREKNNQHLIDEFVDYLEEISLKSFELMKDKYAHVYDELAEREQAEREGSDQKIGLTAASLKDILDSYLQELPVLGFNSSNYDINVIKIYLFKKLCAAGEEEEAESMDGEINGESIGANESLDERAAEEEGEETVDERAEESKWVTTRGGVKYLVKQNNTFKCIATPSLKFLDINSYLAPGCSYAKYLAAFGVTEKKGYWPYEYIDSVARLEETELPPHSAFYSSLKNNNISESEYRECQRVWEEKDMQNLGDLLEYYNNLDVQPFLCAIAEQTKFYQERGIDMFKDGIGVPGLTLRYLFKTLPSKDVYFSLFSDDQADLHSLLRDNLVGGPSIIFDRYHEKGKTQIRGGEKKVECLEGYDANALYLWSIMQNMPTGTPVIRRKTDNFAPKRRGKYGLLAREWIEWRAHEKKKSESAFKHKFNHGEERLGKRNLPVDGWDPDSKTAYQFHGCAFHGCDKCKAGKKAFPHPFKPKVPRAELIEKTREVTEYLRETVGVTVIEMWECEWRRLKARDPRIRAFLKKRSLQSSYTSPFDRDQEIDDKSIIEAVKNEKLFGLVQCDVEVPEGLREHFSEMQPIFKNADISKNDIGDFMKEYAEEHGLLSQPRRSLIGSFFAKQRLFTTPLLKWYLEHGIEVSNVTTVLEYEPSACFKKFGESVSEARRAGDIDSAKCILAETMKLIGNSSYGKTLTNINNHCDIYFLNDKDTAKKINSPLFKKATPLSDDWNEVEMRKPNLIHKLPLHIGFFVYQYAKLRMVDFHYGLIDRFVDRSNYQLSEMDTDSYYMALSTPTLEDAIRPELRRQFFEEYHHWFPSPACDDHRADFIESRVAHREWQPRVPCCVQRKAFDKRTPGLFKLEYKGDGIIALCSKTYLCFNGQNTKTSAKGISKRLNHLTKEKYMRVLRSRQSGSGVNKSFRLHGRHMYTYTQTRDALSFFYIKRQVAANGTSTSPLNI